MTTNATETKPTTTTKALAPIDNVRNLLMRLKPQFAMALPRHIAPERLIRVAITTMQRNQELLLCSQSSLLGAIMQCAQLGLEPDGLLGHAYLVPFKNSKTGKSECTLIIGYKGLIELARRSGQIQQIEAHAVYEKDHFKFSFGLAPTLEWIPSDAADRGKMTHAWGKAVFKDGGIHAEIMNRTDIERIKASAKAKDFGPWKTHEEEMWKKTVIRRMCKYLPLSPELQRQVAKEELLDAGAALEDLDLDEDVEGVLDLQNETKTDQLASKLSQGDLK